RIRLTSCQDAQAMDRAGDRGLQGRNGREGRAQLRLRTGGVELGAASGTEALGGDAQTLALVLYVATGNRKLVLRAPQLEVGARDLGDDRYLRVTQIGLGSLQVSACGFVLPANAAEQVELPGGIEARVVQLVLVAGPHGAGGRRDLLFGVAAGSGDRRSEIEQRLVAGSARLDQAPEGDAQIVVGVEGVV